jgi:O-antigen/teichoic acid export membrane protein
MASAFKNLAILTSGTSLSQLIPFLSAPIISRLFSPSDFADFTLYTSILSILILFSTFKYEMAIQLPEDSEESLRIVNVCIAISFAVFIVSLVVMSVLVLLKVVDNIYMLMPFTAFLFSVCLIIERVYNRRQSYTSMSILKVTKTTSETFYNLVGFISFFKKFNLIIGLTAGYFCSFIFILQKEWGILRNALNSLLSPSNKEIIIKYSNFPVYNLPHALLNSISTSLPIFIIPLYFSKEELGYFSFGLKYVQAPLAILSGALYSIISQELSILLHNRQALVNKFNFFLKNLFFASAFILMGLILSPFIFKYIFGFQWMEAGKYIVIISILIVLGFILSSLAYVPILFHKQRKALIIEVFYFFAKLLPFLFVAGYLKADFRTTLVIYTILSSLVLLYTFNWYRKLIYNQK